MQKKKPSKPARSKAAPRKKKQIEAPDTSVLANFSPTDSAKSHPDWVKKKFPDYVMAGMGHEATSVREFMHGGHLVKIITTYRVEVDGKPVHAHLSVDEDGQVYTHATPFVTYDSAVDLMNAVIDKYPDAFSDSGGHDHGGHEHGSRGAGRKS